MLDIKYTIEKKLKILEIVADLNSSEINDLISKSEKIWKYIHDDGFVEKNSKDTLKNIKHGKYNPTTLTFEKTLKDPVYIFIVEQILRLGNTLDNVFAVSGSEKYQLLNFEKEKLPDYFHEDAKTKIMESIKQLQKIYDYKREMYHKEVCVDNNIKGPYYEENQKEEII